MLKGIVSWPAIIESSPSNLFDNINYFVTGWIYAGLLFIAAFYLSWKIGWVQFLRLKQMALCFLFSEKKSGENVSPFKAIVASLASRFGLGNVVGVGLAVVLAGPGVILWMIFFGLISIGTAVCESTLAQIYKEKDPLEKGLYRGGTPYYILKGLGKNFKWLAIAYAVFNIFAKGLFIVDSSVNSVTDIFGYSINSNYNADSLTEPFMWLIIAILAIMVFLTAFTGVKKIINVISKVAPVIIVLFLLFAFLYVSFNANYLGDFFQYLFVGAIMPSSFFLGFLGHSVAKSINTVAINGSSRGIFANEAGQGSTTFSAASSVIDHPVRMGFSQGFVAFFDTTIICLLSGVIYSVGIIKMQHLPFDHIRPFTISDLDTNLGSNLTQLTYQVFADFLPYGWNKSGHLDLVGIIPLCIIIFSCGYMVISGCILITEFSLLFLCRNLSELNTKKIIKTYHFVIPVIIFLAPIVKHVSANVFTISDFLVAICFIVNIICLISLVPTVQVAIKDFKSQVKHNNDLKKSLFFDANKLLIHDNEHKPL